MTLKYTYVDAREGLNLPLTSIICGFSPGACVRDMIVTADTWAIDLTVAAQTHGAPINPQPVFIMQTNKMSR